MEVFRETQAYLLEIIRDAKVSQDSIWNFNRTHQSALFLFGPEMQAYLTEIQSLSIDVNSYIFLYNEGKLESERSDLSDKHYQDLAWLTAQHGKIFERFRPFMSFE